MVAQRQAKGTNAAAVQTSYAAPVAPFVLSLVAGLLILVGGGMMLPFSNGTRYHGMMGDYGGVMSSYYNMMRGFGGSGLFYGAAALGLIAGTVILVGAIMIYVRPRSTPTWGLVVLVFSILSFFGTGGFFIGAALGIVGGILAMTGRPEAAAG